MQQRTSAAPAVANMFLGTLEKNGSVDSLGQIHGDVFPYEARVDTGRLVDATLDQLPRLPVTLNERTYSLMASAAGRLHDSVVIVQESHHGPGHRDPDHYRYGCFYQIGGLLEGVTMSESDTLQVGGELLLAHPSAETKRDHDDNAVGAASLVRPVKVVSSPEGDSRNGDWPPVPFVVVFDKEAQPDRVLQELQSWGLGEEANVRMFQSQEPLHSPVSAPKTINNFTPNVLQAYGVPRRLSELMEQFTTLEKQRFWENAVRGFVERHAQKLLQDT